MYFIFNVGLSFSRILITYFNPEQYVYINVFPCVYKRMLKWFPSFQVATTFFSGNLPDLNFLVTFFSYLFTCKIITATE